MNKRNDVFVFLHIGKTAGSSVRTAISSQFKAREVCPHIFYSQIAEMSEQEIRKYRLFAAHIGFDQAQELSGQIFTVLRDPVDRVLSLYSHVLQQYVNH